ncbi:MAG: hypothetical protein LUH02_01395 [Erysipelotrichaceae bacterium]|nr:hypothetical protein [Erysipelotrichaceae bacterium]
MEIRMTLGGIHFLFISKRNIKVSKMFDKFLDKNDYKPDITIPIIWEWNNDCIATTLMLGKDLQQHYYEDNDLFYCQTWGGPKGYIASTIYTKNFSEITCYVNQEPFINPLNEMTTLIRYLPMREIFQYYGVIFFHAAQIEVNGKGILFTAPSDTGKTTQAHLWQEYKGAELICNDRTLVRKNNHLWNSFGYPVDGSTPVRSGKILPLGAVVLLQQASTNEMINVSTIKLASLLMEQMVIDVWSPVARERGLNLALDLLEDVPVCYFGCTPDETAVICLEQWLKEKGFV